MITKIIVKYNRIERGKNMGSTLCLLPWELLQHSKLVIPLGQDYFCKWYSTPLWLFS